MSNTNRLVELRNMQDRAHHPHEVGKVLRELLNLMIEDEKDRPEHDIFAATVRPHEHGVSGLILSRTIPQEEESDA